MTTSQKGRIFISYRRIDTSYAAGRIYDRLAAHFGEEAIFMDVEVIEGGLDFVKVLEDAVQSCDVLIALIGRQWLNTKDEGGNRRLDNPDDFVRIEIAAALKRDIRVIPVLVDGIDMPRSTELPENLKLLARRNALQVNHHSFNPDVYRLIAHIESALKAAEESKVIKAQAVRAAREKEEREAAEKADREKAEKDAAEQIAREKKEREAAEKAIHKKAEREATEEAAPEIVEQETVEKFAQEKVSLLEPKHKKPKTKNIIARRIWNSQNTIIFIALVALILITVFGLPSLLSKPESTPTPTSTRTINPTSTYTPTLTRTPTVQLTSTEFFTSTSSVPFDYTVQEGDFLAQIAEKFNLGGDGVELLLFLNPYEEEGKGINPATQILYPGQQILIPSPGMKLPTVTPISPDLPRGTKITYYIQAGDSLASIAARFNSSIDAIIEENDLTDPNAIFVGQQLVVPVNIVTATATRPPTSTSRP